jgi:hypothetical protein
VSSKRIWSKPMTDHTRMIPIADIEAFAGRALEELARQPERLTDDPAMRRRLEFGMVRQVDAVIRAKPRDLARSRAVTPWKARARLGAGAAWSPDLEPGWSLLETEPAGAGSCRRWSCPALALDCRRLRDARARRCPWPDCPGNRACGLRC